MQPKILLNLLDQEGCQYSLVRPICMEKKAEDIDLFIPEKQIHKVVQLLRKRKESASWRPSIGKNTYCFKIGDCLLDIRTHICFMPYKTLVLDLPLPLYSGFKEREEYLLPLLPENILFTLWTFHLLIDKKEPKKSSGFTLYLKMFSEKYEELLGTDYFEMFNTLLFGAQAKELRFALKQAFAAGWESDNQKKLIAIKKSWLRRHKMITLLHLVYSARWIYNHRILQNEFRPIETFTC